MLAESDNLLGSNGGSSRRLILIAVGVAVLAVVLSLSISAIVLSTKAIHDKKTNSNDCLYTRSSNNYTLPIDPPGYLPVSTLIRGATVWTATGHLYENYDIFIKDGIISAIGPSPLPNIGIEATVYDVKGAFVTPGLVDMHSHVGVYSFPADAFANIDVSETTNPTTPQVRIIDAIDPNDPAIPLILSGGVTTSLVLPAGYNLIAGEAYPIKMKGGSVSNMTIKGAPRYFKMAAGENPKKIYGAKGTSPSSRMGNAWGFRSIFADASALKLQQDQWDCIQKTVKGQQSSRPYSAQLEPLVAILRGQALVNIHCFAVEDFETILRVADEFNFNISAFHHALEAYKIPYIFGPRNITIATFSDNWGYKMEAYDASARSPAILAQNGVKVAIKSDHPVIFAKNLIYEAARANHYGLGIESSLHSVSSIPANAIGLGHRVGTLELGKDGDVVVWDKHPLVIGARPTKVFLEGVLKVDNPSSNPPSITPPVVSQEMLVNSSTACTLPSGSYYATAGTMYTMNDNAAISNPLIIVTNGIITCVGDTISCTIPNGFDKYSLSGGFIIPGIISAASSVGIVEVDDEILSGDGTLAVDNGATVYAADGIRLEGRKSWAAWAGGVTVQIAKPQATTLISGVSAAFYTGGNTDEALLDSKAALHITIGNAAKKSALTSSVSGQFSLLRTIFKSAQSDPTNPITQAIIGNLPVVFSIDQASEIRSLLRFIAEFNLYNTSTILGGAEAATVTSKIKENDVSVILSPVQSNPATFETQRSTDADPGILASAGINLGIAEFKAGNVRNLRWNAGQTLSNGLNYTQALATITRNVAKALRLPQGTGTITVGTKANFVLYDADPLTMGSKVAAVALGKYVQCNPQQF